MGRRPCCDKIGMTKGPWSAEEDQKLINFILNHEQCCWRTVPTLAGLLRCGKSCRLRWINYLRPDLKRGLLSESEEKLVIDLHSQFGNKWSKIASHMPGRTDNEIKNLWHTHIKKKLNKMGIDPVTHKPLAPDHHQDPEKEETILLLEDQSTITNDDQSQEALEQITQGLHEQDKDQEKEGTLLLEGCTITDDPLAQEKMEMETINDFSVDEVPLMEPHEILVPNSDLTSACSSTSFSSETLNTISMSTIESILEDLKCLPPFEDWQADDIHGKSYNGNEDFPYSDDFTDWDLLINDIDIDYIGHEIIQSPPDTANSPLLKKGLI